MEEPRADLSRASDSEHLVNISKFRNSSKQPSGATSTYQLEGGNLNDKAASSRMGSNSKNTQNILEGNRVGDSPRNQSSSHNNSQDPVILKQASINNTIVERHDERSVESSQSESDFSEDLSNCNEETHHNNKLTDNKPRKRRGFNKRGSC